MTAKPRLATIWLDGCSGCHMSLLDMDERLLEITERADIVYGALVDFKEFPENVDVTLVEGAVSSRTTCARSSRSAATPASWCRSATARSRPTCPGMRNPIGPGPILERAYLENVTMHPQLPGPLVPRLLPLSRPVHAVVKVDVFVPGCPPSADLIHCVLDDLISGRIPLPRG